MKTKKHGMSSIIEREIKRFHKKGYKIYYLYNNKIEENLWGGKNE